MKLILGILFSVLIGSEADWSVYFENKKIKISYKDTLCDDVNNGVSFEYYIIKVRNKTNETLVINFYLGEKKSEENKTAFVLNPFETKIGSCSYQPIKLKLFKVENSNKKLESIEKFILNNIQTIEVF